MKKGVAIISGNVESSKPKDCSETSDKKKTNEEAVKDALKEIRI